MIRGVQISKVLFSSKPSRFSSKSSKSSSKPSMISSIFERAMQKFKGNNSEETQDNEIYHKTFLKTPEINSLGEMRLQQLNVSNQSKVWSRENILTFTYRNYAYIKRERPVGPVIPCVIDSILITPGKSYPPGFRAFEVTVKESEIFDKEILAKIKDNYGIQMRFLKENTEGGDGYVAGSSYYYDDYGDGDGDSGGGDGD